MEDGLAAALPHPLPHGEAAVALEGMGYKWKP